MAKATRYFFYGRGRSGSHLLGGFIEQHPQAIFDDELFLEARLSCLNSLQRIIARKLPFIYLNYRVKVNAKPVYGFSFLHHNHLETNLTIHQLADKGWKMIYLKRQDCFEQMISNYVAEKRSKWHNLEGKEHINSETLELNINEAILRLKNTYEERERERAVTKLIPHLEIGFEEELVNPAKRGLTMNKVFEFLNLEPIKLAKSKYQKIYTKPYSQLVLNYNEIYAEAKRQGLTNQ